MPNDILPHPRMTVTEIATLPVAVVNADPLVAQGLARLFEHSGGTGPVSVFEHVWSVDRDATYGLVVLTARPTMEDLIFEITTMRTLRIPPALVVVAALPSAGFALAPVLAAGADVVLSGRETPSEISVILGAAAAGFGVFSTALARHLPAERASVIPANSPYRNGAETPVPLTRRQREVAALVGEGMSNKQIAFKLRLSAGTVKIHITAVLRAYAVPTRTALVARLLRQSNDMHLGE